MEILRALLDDFGEDPAARSLAFDISLPESAPVRAARSHVMRGLFNLLDNAVRKCGEKWKDDPGGRVSVTLESGRGEKEKDRWVITITDNGPGISSETEDSVFESLRGGSFHGSRGGGKWGFDGHGLGLSITARVLRAHGGDVELVKKSSPDSEGASFRITLPKDTSLN